MKKLDITCDGYVRSLNHDLFEARLIANIESIRLYAYVAALPESTERERMGLITTAVRKFQADLVALKRELNEMDLEG